MELREIVLAAYRGRNEVLRVSLSPSANEALSRALEGGELLPNKNREDQLRKFLTHDWTTGFHDVRVVGSVVIPDAVGSTIGQDVFETLSSESKAIVKDYKSVMNAPWKAYCELQRRWAETDAVREMEHTGDLSLKKLSGKERSDTSESHKHLMLGFGLALQRFSSLVQLAHDPWIRQANWQFSSCTDLLFRRRFTKLVGKSLIGWFVTLA